MAEFTSSISFSVKMALKFIVLALCLGVLNFVSADKLYGKKYSKNRQRPGVCPVSWGPNNGQSCRYDWECPIRMKCCPLGFIPTPTCTYVDAFPGPAPGPLPGPGPFPGPYPLPVPGPRGKSGRCPRNAQAGICGILCNNDYECRGDLKCCSTGCGYSCQRPVFFGKKY